MWILLTLIKEDWRELNFLKVSEMSTAHGGVSLFLLSHKGRGAHTYRGKEREKDTHRYRERERDTYTGVV